MLLLSQKKSLQNILIVGLARHGALSASELFTYTNKTFRSVTIQGIYHELRKLIALGAVLHQGMKYRLSVVWAFAVSDIAREILESALDADTTSELLPGPGKKKVWGFGKITSADDFYLHSLTTLLKFSGASSSYEWCPYPWFHLVSGKKESQFQRALETMQSRTFVILGGDTPIHREFVRSLKGTSNAYSTRRGPFRDLPSTYFAVVGDFVLSIKQPKRAMTAIHALFHGSEAGEQRERLLRSLVQTRYSIKVRIENNSDKADRLRGQFQRFFG